MHELNCTLRRYPEMARQLSRCGVLQKFGYASYVYFGIDEVGEVAGRMSHCDRDFIARGSNHKLAESLFVGQGRTYYAAGLNLNAVFIFGRKLVDWDLDGSWQLETRHAPDDC